MEKIFHTNKDQKTAGIALLVSENISVWPEIVMTDRESHYIMIKGSICQGDITIVTIYAPNKRRSK